MLSVELFDLYRLDRLGCGIEPIRVDESELRSRPLVARLELCRPCWLSGFDVCDRGLHLCLVVRPRAECCGLTALARVLDFDQCERWLPPPPPPPPPGPPRGPPPPRPPPPGGGAVLPPPLP